MLKILLAAAIAAAAMPSIAQPQAPRATLRVKLFPGAHELPVMAAVSQGLFEKHGVRVEPAFTVNSQELRDDLGAGRVQLAQSAVDNAVAMVELAKLDVLIVTGGDSSMNEVFVQSDVPSIQALRGATLAVDAPNTAYALQLKKILLNAGLREGADYTVKPVGGTFLRLKAMRENRELRATMLNPPFSIEGAAAGLKSLGRTADLLGPYQAQGTFVMRKWALENPEVLERYIAGFIEGVRWVKDPANRAAATRMLTERLKVSPEVAARSLDWVVDDKYGYAADARFDQQGFRNMLALRAEIEGSWGGTPPPPERYVDLRYYEGALRRLAR